MQAVLPAKLPVERPFALANKYLLGKTATIAWECCLREQKPVEKQEPAVLKTEIAPGPDEERDRAV